MDGLGASDWAPTDFGTCFCVIILLFFFSDQFIDRADERTAWTAPELCYKTYDGTAGVTNSDVRVSQVVGNSVLRRKNGRDKIFSGNQGKEPQNRGDGFGEAGSKD